MADGAALVGPGPRGVRIWRVWVLLAVAPVLLMAISTVYATALVVQAKGDTSVIGPGMGRGLPYIVMLNHTILMGLLVWFLRKDGQSLGSIGWSCRAESRYWWVEIGVGLLGGAVIYAVQMFVSEPLVAWAHSFVPDFRAATGTSVAPSVAGLLVATLFAGVVEESIYRGYAIRRLGEKLGVVWAVAISTLFFTVFHFGLGWSGMTVVFVNGLLLALLFVWRRALLGVAIAHACVNVLVLTV